MFLQRLKLFVWLVSPGLDSAVKCQACFLLNGLAGGLLRACACELLLGKVEECCVRSLFYIKITNRGIFYFSH